MVESLVVISIMILFFLGMLFFEGLYTQKLHVMSMARSAAVAHAMNACQGDPVGYIESQISGTTSLSVPQPGGTIDFLGKSPPQVGLSGVGPVSSWLDTLNYGVEQPTQIDVSGKVSASMKSQSGPGTTFSATPATISYALCGDKGSKGNYPNVVQSISIHDAFPF
jgi:hypothetical protein